MTLGRPINVPETYTRRRTFEQYRHVVEGKLRLGIKQQIKQTQRMGRTPVCSSGSY